MSKPQEDTSRHIRAQRLFEEVCDLSVTERNSHLDQACAGDPELRKFIDSLLDADVGDVLEQPIVPPMVTDILPAIPEKIDGYRILEQIGSGGMGVVFKAEQEQTSRQVALKLLRADLTSEDLVRRFELEAEALGRLNHPNIASIYAVGMAQIGQRAQSYFAMELVEGSAIVDYVKREALAASEIFDLVARVADAMVHAHQKGVIHRDLKPANILVTAEGQPKVLDFGIARLADYENEASALMTQTGEMMGTLAYMSPEQLSGDPHAIDARTDVYALGVLLYELLAGKRPFDATGKPLASVIRLVLESDPEPLHRVDPSLGGDAESIVRKAMEQEASRRYQSAGEMARDIRRFLAHETISARSPTASYRIKKFVRRNRALVAGASAIAIALVAVTTVSVVQAIRVNAAYEQRGVALADRERALKEKGTALLEKEAALGERTLALKDSNTTVNFFTNMLEAADGYKSGGETTLREFLAQSAESIDGNLDTRPMVAARLKHSIGKALFGVDAAKAGEPLLRQAHDLFKEVLGESDLTTLAARADLGRSLVSLKRWEEASAAFDAVISTGSEAFGSEHPVVISAAAHKAFRVDPYFSKAGDLKAKAIEMLPVIIRVLGPDHYDTTLVQRLLGQQHYNSSEYEEAVVQFEAALESRARVYGENHPVVADATTSLITTYSSLKRYEEAQQLAERARAIYEGSIGLNHRNALRNQAAALDALNASGNTEAAVVLTQDLLERHMATLGDSSGHTFQMVITAVHVFESASMGAEAREWSEKGVAIAKRAFQKDHYAVGYALSEYAHILVATREYDLAIEAATKGLDILEKSGAPDSLKADAQRALEKAKDRKKNGYSPK